jgi:HEAT repeat protein
MRAQQATKQQRRETLKLRVQRVAGERGMEQRAGEELIGYLAVTEELAAWAATDILLERGAASVPALLAGLSHPEDKIRATCALLLDHVADDRCVEPLLRAIRHDPLEAVRRCALHSLVCDGCKSCPLTVDIVGALIEVAQTDRSLAVRRRAVFYLSMQRADPRIIPFLQDLMARATDPVLLRRAANALHHHEETQR